jgi:hypothetical protein
MSGVSLHFGQEADPLSYFAVLWRGLTLASMPADIAHRALHHPLQLHQTTKTHAGITASLQLLSIYCSAKHRNDECSKRRVQSKS